MRLWTVHSVYNVALVSVTIASSMAMHITAQSSLMIKCNDELDGVMFKLSGLPTVSTIRC
jgi:hypothetical protein